MGKKGFLRMESLVYNPIKDAANRIRGSLRIGGWASDDSQGTSTNQSSEMIKQLSTKSTPGVGAHSSLLSTKSSPGVGAHASMLSDQSSLSASSATRSKSREARFDVNAQDSCERVKFVAEKDVEYAK